MHLSVSIDSNIRSNFVTVPKSFSKSVEDRNLADTGVKALRIGWMSKEKDQPATKNHCFVSWNGAVSDSNDIRIPKELAVNEGLFKAFEAATRVSSGFANFPAFIVSVSLVNYSPIASRVDIDPIRLQDWEIISSGSNARFVEDNLLSQLCVVSPNQQFSMFLSDKIIKFKIKNILASGMVISSHCVRLARNTEIIIAPKLQDLEQNSKSKKENKDLKENEFKISKVFHITAIHLKKNGLNNSLHNHSTIMISRKVFTSLQHNIKPKLILKSNLIFVEKEKLPLVFGLCKQVISEKILNLQKKLLKSQKEEVESIKISLNKLYMRMIPCLLKVKEKKEKQKKNEQKEDSEDIGIVYLNKLQFRKVKVLEFNTVSLCYCLGTKLIFNKLPSILNIIFFNDGKQKLDNEEVKKELFSSLKTEESKNNFYVLFDKAVFELNVNAKNQEETNGTEREKETLGGPIEKYLMKLYLPKIKKERRTSIYVLSHQQVLDIFEKSEVNISSTQLRKLNSSSSNQNNDDIFFSSIGLPEKSEYYNLCFDNLISNLQKEINLNFSLSIPCNHIFIYGKHLSGKTYILKSLYCSLKLQEDGFMSITYIDCLKYAHSTRKIVKQVFDDVFKKISSTKYKNILLLDNLDKLLPNSNNNQYDKQIVWLSEYLKHQILSTRSNYFLIIATTLEKTSLMSSLREPYLFKTEYKIEQLKLEQRKQLLLKILELEKFVIQEGVDIEEVVSRFDSYLLGDIFNYIKRLKVFQSLRVQKDKFSSSSKEMLDQKVITMEDFEKTFEKFIPISLLSTDVKNKQDEGSYKWTEIGGLKTAKTLLLDTLQKPLLFQRLFDSCKHRQPSGVLIYGPPGCGKTLLAKSLTSAFQVAAKSLRISFISIKGPEVLDKYIGASEQNIRDLFQKAGNAAPCVLFFDEFEALAPKRGSDSTGVTDRVVNQLLTFLDGVEKTTGVYVLAASSRPDLLDPALLRPGRLDRHILTDFPTKEERLDILLKTLSSTNTLDYDEDVVQLVKQLEEREEVLDGYSGADLSSIIITAQVQALKRDSETISGADFKLGLSESRASVGKAERLKLRSIYRKFKGDRDANFDHVSGFDEGKQRIALK